MLAKQLGEDCEMAIPDYQNIMLSLLKLSSDCAKLVELMIDHDVGVATEAIYQLKRVDSDYFAE